MSGVSQANSGIKRERKVSCIATEERDISECCFLSPIAMVFFFFLLRDWAWERKQIPFYIEM